MRDNNATYVELNGVKVVLGPTPAEFEVPEAKGETRDIYDHPALWGDKGRPRLGE